MYAIFLKSGEIWNYWLISTSGSINCGRSLFLVVLVPHLSWWWPPSEWWQRPHSLRENVGRWLKNTVFYLYSATDILDSVEYHVVVGRVSNISRFQGQPSCQPYIIRQNFKFFGFSIRDYVAYFNSHWVYYFNWTGQEIRVVAHTQTEISSGVTGNDELDMGIKSFYNDDVSSRLEDVLFWKFHL